MVEFRLNNQSIKKQLKPKLLDDFFDGNILPQFDFLNPINTDLSDLLDKKENV